MSPREAWFRRVLVDDINIVAPVPRLRLWRLSRRLEHEFLLCGRIPPEVEVTQCALRDCNVNGMLEKENHPCIAN